MTDEPIPVDASLERAESEAAAEVGATAAGQTPIDDAGAEDIGDGLTSNDYSVAFSPRQVAVGFAIVAGLVAFAASRHHRTRRKDA